MRIKPQLLGMEPYKPGKPIEEVKKELGLSEVQKLASNENPFGASENAIKAIREAASNPQIYPDGYASELRRAVAEHVNVKEQQLIFGAGSDEVILMLCRSLLGPDTNTVMAAPTFSQYKHNAVIEGAEIREVPLRDGTHDLNAMLKLIDENTRIVWVCNPNNPSGTYTTKREWSQFLASVPEHVLVVSDEAYKEYVTAEDYPDSLNDLNRYKNLMILRTFSKAYGLASLRIGYGIGHSDFIQSLDPVRPPFNTTTIAQKAALAAVKDQAYIQECFHRNYKGLEKLETYCKHKNLEYLPSQANFMLIYTGISGDKMFSSLLQKGYIIRSGEALGFPNAIRVTIGSDEQMIGFLEAFEESLEEHKQML
ncbi:histidinol-phosphate transaminase [Alteribacillus sp. HJP-4]|uniref:histidinol-phosphate transaminase n=1 Tax=Alteribacillus sp. HJP-4 TaxID=2775394 RepID=UPI0035CD0266